MTEGNAVEIGNREDRFVVPEQWRLVMHPRRGAVGGAGDGPVPEHTGSTAALEKLHATLNVSDVRTIAEDERAPVNVGVALRRQLEGESSPLGTAVMSLLTVEDESRDLPAHLDAWITAYGLGFAAAATVEAAGLDVNTDRGRFDSVVREFGAPGLPRRLMPTIRRLRCHLAAAPDADYGLAVRALEPHRRDLRRRALVSYLLPDESAWLAEACEEVGKSKLRTGQWRPLAALLQCSVDRPEQVRALRKRRFFHAEFSDLGVFATAAENLGADVVELFVGILDSRAATAEVRRTALDVISRIPGDEAFTLLTERLTQKHVQAATIRAAEAFPHRGIRLLTTAACAEGPNAEAASNLLAGQLVRHPDVAAAVRPALTEDQRALSDALRTKRAPRPAAATSGLPAVLVDPPWTRERPRGGAAAGSPELAALRAPATTRLDWQPGEHESFAQHRPSGNPLAPEAMAEALAEIARNGTSGRLYLDWHVLLTAPEDEARRALAALRTEVSVNQHVAEFRTLLARFGVDAVDFLLGAGGKSADSLGRLLQPVVDLRVARLMADWLHRLKGDHALAENWFARHSEEAVVLLVPDAVRRSASGTGPGSRRSAAAVGALRYLDATGFEVVAVAERVYGATAALAVKTMLETDPLELAPARPPKLADWLTETPLPQILLRGRRTALPAESVRHVLTMLAISRPGQPYPGLESVKEYTDPVSLAAFGRALLAAWRTMDHPGEESWILTAQGFIGDEDTLRLLVPLVAAWPRTGGHQRSVAALGLLADAGTPYAHLQLQRISRASPKRAVNRKAREKLNEVGEKLGLTAEELADRSLPGLGLDAEAARWLDYGPRRFQVRYDQDLRPALHDGTGALLPSGLPEPDATDDLELAETARRRLDSLNEDVHLVLSHAIRQFESSMVMDRSWTAAQFRSPLMVEHPLLWRLVCRLVWLCESDGAETAFRVVEDRGFADVDDEGFVLPEHAVVRVAHPLRLGTQLGAWGELFADYEILQPFPQLGRPVYAFTEEDRASAVLSRFDGNAASSAEVRALLDREWEPDGDFHENRLVRPTPDGRWLGLTLQPGLWTASGDAGEQRLGSVTLATERNPTRGSGAKKQTLDLRELDPISASELLADLYRLSDH